MITLLARLVGFLLVRAPMKIISFGLIMAISVAVAMTATAAFVAHAPGSIYAHFGWEFPAGSITDIAVGCGVATFIGMFLLSRTRNFLGTFSFAIVTIGIGVYWIYMIQPQIHDPIRQTVDQLKHVGGALVSAAHQ